MDGWDLVLIGSVLIGYAGVSRRLSGTVVTSAIVFVAVGLVTGTEGLDVIEFGIASEDLRLLAEVTLALVLFADASALDARELRRQASIPTRLLAVALPLSIVLGTIVALPLFSKLGVFEAAMLAILLAPTDAALGQTVVSDERLPTPIRQGLSVESGLNDGVCVPLLVAAVAAAELEERPSFEGEILVDLFKEVSVAVAVGLVAATAVALLVRASRRRGWMSDGWGRIVPLATVAVAYLGTAELGGSGFIGVFVAGLAYGRLLGEFAHGSVTLDEELGQLLSAVTFLFFGAVMVGPALRDLDAATLVYAGLSLTVVRMVPVAVSLIGTGATRPTRLFVGWFGPRGLATIVFALTIVEESELPGTPTITTAATIAVFMSVVAHGATAPWLSDRYTLWLSAHPEPLAVSIRSSDGATGPDPDSTPTSSRSAHTPEEETGP